MPIGIAAGAAVASWGAGTIATAVVVGAVNGLIAGAVIGAATSIVTGGDIVEGTLKGALIGGVTGGVLNGAAEGVFGAGVGVEEAGAAGEFLKQSPNATLSEAVQYGKDYVTTPAGASAGGSAGSAPGLIQGAGGGPPDYSKMTPADLAKLSAEERVAAIQQQTAAAQSTANSQALKTSASLGLATGAGTGVFQLAGNKMAAKTREEELKQAAASERSRVEGNQPGDFRQRLAKFRLPEAWTTAISSPLDKYRKPAPGLLQGGAA